jgi:LacI family transcriptional regulator
VSPELIRTGTPLIEFGFRESTALLASAQPPTAIIAGGHGLLVGTLRAVQNAGLAVGQDISLITVGDSDLTEHMTPPISAVTWDGYEMGRLSAQILMDSITGKGPAERRRIIIPTALALRESCHRIGGG